MEEKIIVYGTDWCPDCIKVRKYFDIKNIEYTWINISNDLDARGVVERINNGNRSVPTIIWPDGSTQVEPSLSELRDSIGKLTTD